MSKLAKIALLGAGIIYRDSQENDFAPVRDAMFFPPFKSRVISNSRRETISHLGILTEDCLHP
jgi:hypothetical protein